MRIACLQFAPQLGDVDNNLNRADALLNRANPKGLDLLVLPELAFTGYSFKSLGHITPYLEHSGSGITSLWARTVALNYECVVTVGYPEKVDLRHKWPSSPEYYSSALTVNADGDTVANYRKTFLAARDETWALEGPDGFFHGVIPGLGKAAMGISTDLDPSKFNPSWGTWEFAYNILYEKANLVIISMAWVTSRDLGAHSANSAEPDLDALAYWVARLEPLIRADTEGEIIVVLANRCGAEDHVIYAGTSCVLGIEGGEVRVYGILGRGDKDLLVVDTKDGPKYKLVAEPNSPVAEDTTQDARGSTHEYPGGDSMCKQTGLEQDLLAGIDAILDVITHFSPQISPHFPPHGFVQEESNSEKQPASTPAKVESRLPAGEIQSSSTNVMPVSSSVPIIKEPRAPRERKCSQTLPPDLPPMSSEHQKEVIHIGIDTDRSQPEREDLATSASSMIANASPPLPNTTWETKANAPWKPRADTPWEPWGEKPWDKSSTHVIAEEALYPPQKSPGNSPVMSFSRRTSPTTTQNAEDILQKRYTPRNSAGNSPAKSSSRRASPTAAQSAGEALQKRHTPRNSLDNSPVKSSSRRTSPTTAQSAGEALQKQHTPRNSLDNSPVKSSSRRTSPTTAQSAGEALQKQHTPRSSLDNSPVKSSSRRASPTTPRNANEILECTQTPSPLAGGSPRRNSPGTTMTETTEAPSPLAASTAPASLNATQRAQELQKPSIPPITNSHRGAPRLTTNFSQRNAPDTRAMTPWEPRVTTPWDPRVPKPWESSSGFTTEETNKAKKFSAQKVITTRTAEGSFQNTQSPGISSTRTSGRNSSPARPPQPERRPQPGDIVTANSPLANAIEEPGPGPFTPEEVACTLGFDNCLAIGKCGKPAPSSAIMHEREITDIAESPGTQLASRTGLLPPSTTLGGGEELAAPIDPVKLYERHESPSVQLLGAPADEPRSPTSRSSSRSSHQRKVTPDAPADLPTDRQRSSPSFPIPRSRGVGRPKLQERGFASIPFEEAFVPQRAPPPRPASQNITQLPNPRDLPPRLKSSRNAQLPKSRDLPPRPTSYYDPQLPKSRDLPLRPMSQIITQPPNSIGLPLRPKPHYNTQLPKSRDLPPRPMSQHITQLPPSRDPEFASRNSAKPPGAAPTIGLLEEFGVQSHPSRDSIRTRRRGEQSLLPQVLNIELARKSSTDAPLPLTTMSHLPPREGITVRHVIEPIALPIEEVQPKSPCRPADSPSKGLSYRRCCMWLNRQKRLHRARSSIW